MLKSIAFGEFLPDRSESVFRVQNAWPTPEGYRPVLAPSAITTALPGYAGGSAFVGSDGAASLLSGTVVGLYRFSSGTWSELILASANVWRFDQFGDRVIAVNGGAPVSYDLTAGSAATLAGDPPTSSLVATVRQQVFLAGDPNANNVVSISGYNDSEGWAAGVNQCLYVPFPSGGRITGLAGGETGLILQERSIKRATYTGDDTVWQFDEISRDVGCMAPGSIAQAGSAVFFLSEQGFKVTDRNTVTAIGAEKVDRSFFATYQREDIVNRISAAVDPRTTTVIWSMPGNPGTLWCYNWTLDRWSTISIPTLGVFSGFTANVSLEGVDILYPGGIDSVPYSLDAPIFAGGNPLFLNAAWDGTIGPLAGATLPARFNIRPIEIERGYRVRISGARALSDAVTGTVTLDARARAGDPEKRRVSGTIRNNGRVAIRANGRHVGTEYTLPAGATWTYVNGLDLEYETAGVR
ncbi:hypothetical protein [Sphingobium sp. YR768]|uniref:hypothetical protein n=1 Tax=Sphingobium sp. YR768 TaxID=1884365 RepID=UPI000B86A104|nr:hypothetical protein [Sphingobium sp. YR768]